MSLFSVSHRDNAKAKTQFKSLTFENLSLEIVKYWGRAIMSHSKKCNINKIDPIAIMKFQCPGATYVTSPVRISPWWLHHELFLWPLPVLRVLRDLWVLRVLRGFEGSASFASIASSQSSHSFVSSVNFTRIVIIPELPELLWIKCQIALVCLIILFLCIVSHCTVCSPVTRHIFIPPDKILPLNEQLSNV